MNKLEFSIAKKAINCLECGDNRIPYKDKKNISWNIKWHSDDNLFAFFLYIRSKEGIRTHYDLIPNELLKLALGNTKIMNDLAEACINRLSKLYGEDWNK